MPIDDHGAYICGRCWRGDHPGESDPAAHGAGLCECVCGRRPAPRPGPRLERTGA